MDNFSIVSRQEGAYRYDCNKEVNEFISEMYERSFKNISSEIIEKKDVENMSVEILTTANSGHIQYGVTTLGMSGCAVLCFEEGLQFRQTPFCIAHLAEILAEKGYYEPGKGTYHSLFDHYGLKRCASVHDVVETITDNSVFTALVSNAKYHNDAEREGNHFVNLVGIKDGKAIIDDPLEGRIRKDFMEFIQSTKIVWQW